MSGFAIWKYPLKAVTRQTIQVPKGSLFQSAIWQDDRIVVYAIVAPDIPVKDHEILVVTTGQEFDMRGTKFIATVPVMDGLVFHVYHYDPKIVAANKRLAEEIKAGTV